jgi:hypothetical protein
MNHSRWWIRATWPGLLTLLITFAGAAAWVAQPLKLVVSPEGNDAWSGRLEAPNSTRTDGPLATLGHARDLVRRMKRHPKTAGSITILVRAGSYEHRDTGVPPRGRRLAHRAGRLQVLSR